VEGGREKVDRVSGTIQLFFSLQKGLTTCHPRKSPVLVEQWPGDDRSVRHDIKGADYLSADDLSGLVEACCRCSMMMR
jgi:hypothetical protein